VTRFKRGQREIAVRVHGLFALGCVFGLGLACSIDDRVGKLASEPGSNEANETTSSAPGAGGSAGPGSAGATAAPPESTVNPALPLSGAAAGSGSGGSLGSSAPGSGGAPAAGGGPGGAGESMGAAGTDPGSGTSGSDPGEPEPIGSCFQQLLSNGGFERGHVAWAETADLRDVIVGRDHAALLGTGVTPQAGDSLAWIGGVPNGDYVMYNTRLQQDVAIPAEAISLTFSGYAWVAQPSPGQAAVDWAVLEVEDPNPESNGIWRIQLWNDQSVTQSWERFEVVTTDMTILSRLAGKTAAVVSYARPDGNGTLSVWLDSLRLEARCPR
jgi:hypothetical protein